MPVSRSRQRNKRKKNTRKKSKTIQQKRPKQIGRRIKMQIFYNLGFQIALTVLFAVFLSLGLYFLKERPELAVWMFFLSVVSVALAVAFFIQERLLYEPETSGTLRPAREPNPLLPPGCQQGSPDAFAVFYGGSVAFTSQGEITIVKIADEPLLSVQRTPNGLLISARIFS